MSLIELKELEFECLYLKKRNKFPSYGGVYAFYSSEGYLIYIGKTNSFKSRFSIHLQSYIKKFVYSVEISKLDYEVDREIYETYYINKHKPLFNTKKVFSYKPAPFLIDNFEDFQSIQHILDELNRKGYVFDIYKKNREDKEITSIKEFTSIEEEVCFFVDKIISYRKTYGKSDIRNELSNYGYNINAIMNKECFDNILTRNGYTLTKMSVLNRCL